MNRSYLIVLALLAACSGGEENGKNDLPPPEARSATEILESLGVAAVRNPPRQTYVNVQGKTVTPDTEKWQPMRKPVSVFYPSAEIFLAGATTDSEAAGVGRMYSLLFDELAPNAAAPARLAAPFTGDQTWLAAGAVNFTKASVSADIDGDGIEEVVLFSVTGTPGAGVGPGAVDTEPAEPRAIRYGVHKQAGREPFTTGPVDADLTYPSANDIVMVDANGNPWAPLLGLARGDVDGDGRDEVLLTVVKTVYILKMPATASESLSVVDSRTFSQEVTSVVAADADGDGRDEIVVCMRSTGWSFFDSSFAAARYTESTDAASSLLTEATFGDFDGDGIPELAIAKAYDNARVELKLLRVTNEGIDATTGLAMNVTVAATPWVALDTGEWNLTGGNEGSLDAYRILPRALDLDGAGLDDLYANGTFFTRIASEPVRLRLDGATYRDPNGTVSILDAQVGVVDGGSVEAAVQKGSAVKENLVLLSLRQGVPAAQLQVFDLDANSNLRLRVEVLRGDDNTAGSTLPWSGITMAVGNLDDDSRRVEYVGHELTFTDPLIIAVLASPPYWKEVAEQDGTYADSYSGWSTTFGTAAGSSTTHGGHVGLSIGFGVELEQDISLFGLKAASFKTSYGFMHSTNVQWANSRSITKEVQFAANGGEDKVVFTSAPLDKYTYRILGSPLSEEIGTTFAVSIPRDYQTYMVSRAYFNQVNGELPDVDGSVLGHTLGEPGSYPSPAAAAVLINSYGGYSAGPLPVSQGDDGVVSGVATVNVTVGTSQTTGVSTDEAFDFSIGLGAGGLSASVKLGFNVGYDYEHSTDQSTSFGGTIGYLPTAYFTDKYRYSTGLFVYPYKDPRLGRIYWVVNYSVTR